MSASALEVAAREGERYIALYDLTGDGDTELGLTEGQIIWIMEKDESGWYFAVTQDGREGFVPKDYVEPFPIAEKGKKRKALFSRILKNKENRSNTETDTGERCICLYDHTGEDETELSFVEGQVITVVEKDESGWYYAVTPDGKEGFVPKSFIEPFPISGVKKGDDKEKKKKAFFSRIMGKKASGTARDPALEGERYIALFDFAGKEESELNLVEGQVITVTEKDESGWFYAVAIDGREGFVPEAFIEPFPISDSNKKRAKKGKKSPAPAPAKVVQPTTSSENENTLGERYRALFDYPGEGESELTMKEGDIVIVTEKDDSGWFFAVSLDGREGFVPKDYIELA